MAHVNVRDTPSVANPTQIPEPPLARFLFADTRLAGFWLLVRVYCGYQWLEAGWSKLQNPAWFGSSAGGALRGFVNGALQKSSGDHPDVTGWYALFLQTFVLPNAALWSNVVTVGELLVGLGLIVGALTGVAAFFGTLMNANYLLAGTVSTNPLLFILGTWLVLAWRVAGWWGLDRWLLPLLGTRWAPGRALCTHVTRQGPSEGTHAGATRAI
jgi:thiosulfate dehydrogenase [quinone] large subunit